MYLKYFKNTFPIKMWPSRASSKKISLHDKGTNHGEREAQAYMGVWGLCPQWGPGASPPGQGGEAP